MFLIGLCGRAMRIPVVLTAHGMHEVLSILSNRIDNIFGPLGIVALKWALKNVCKCISLTDSSKLALVKLGVKPENIFQIPNGVDLHKFESYQPDKDVLRRYGLERYQVALCVSRIAKNKGIDDLIIAASEVSKKFSDVCFVVVGRSWDRKYKQYLENLVKRLGLSGKVVLTGKIPDQDLLSLYKLCTIFLIPSNDETGPLVLLEAMAAGCPIISTRVGFTPEVINSMTNGILVSRHSPMELAKWMMILLSNANLRHAMSRNACETVKHYSWAEVARKTVEVYLQSLNAFGKQNEKPY